MLMRLDPDIQALQGDQVLQHLIVEQFGHSEATHAMHYTGTHAVLVSQRAALFLCRHFGGLLGQDFPFTAEQVVVAPKLSCMALARMKGLLSEDSVDNLLLRALAMAMDSDHVAFKSPLQRDTLVEHLHGRDHLFLKLPCGAMKLGVARAD